MLEKSNSKKEYKNSNEIVVEIKKMVNTRKAIIKRMDACKIKYSKLKAEAKKIKENINKLNKELAHINEIENDRVKKYLRKNIDSIKSEPIFDEDLEKEFEKIDKLNQNYRTLKITHSDISELIDKKLSDLDVEIDDDNSTEPTDDDKTLFNISDATYNIGFDDKDIFLDNSSFLMEGEDALEEHNNS